jgi:glycosyltransferase involved in cell wall biosynthesis
MWPRRICYLTLERKTLQDNKDIFVIIPAYNEEAAIEQVVRDLLPMGYSLVVVDDASTDSTGRVAKGLPVHYLRHRINFGQGAALQTGITYALRMGARLLVTFDADGQHSPEDIPAMINYLETARLDVVFGSRFLSLKPSALPAARKFLLRLARYLNFLVTGILLSDAHNGLRVFSRKAGSKIDILESRMAHATELLITVKRNKFDYGEAPVHIRYTDYSKSKGQKNSHSFKVLQDIILYKIFK